MRTETLWSDFSRLPEFPQLRATIETDVIIVGAGIAGMTAAIELQRAGKSVVVLEARRIAGGETGHTTAHLTELLDARYFSLISKFGRDKATLAADAARYAIDCIETFTGACGTCAFERVPGYLYAETVEQTKELEREFEALKTVGCNVSWVNEFPLAIPVTRALRIENQAQFEPLGYFAELTKHFVSSGGRIFENTEVLAVNDGEPCKVKTPAAEAFARDVLVLASVPVSNRLVMHTRVAAYRSYAVAARLDGPFPAGLFYDLREPYHYVRTQKTPRGSFLIVGGNDHKTGQNDDTEGAFKDLSAYAAEHFGATNVEYRWSGQIIEPADGLPFIGKNPGAEHVYIATGFSGTGLTFGTLAGVILSDEVRRTSNSWAKLFSPDRAKPFAQLGELLVENSDFPGTLVRDRLDRGEVADVASVAAGEGRLVRVKGKMCAVFRDQKGQVHAHSAVCTHFGCYVHWNNAERSWDCPCHGSRFGIDGEVLNGPATRALAPLDAAQEQAEPAVLPAKLDRGG